MNIDSRVDTGAVSARVWRFGDATYDEARRELRVAEQVCPIEAKPLALLHELLVRGGDVATKEELLAAAWPGVRVVEQSLPTAIAKLRAALRDESRTIIEAVHGIGYRLGIPAEIRDAADRPPQNFGFCAGTQVPGRTHWVLESTLGKNPLANVWLARHQKTGAQRVFKFADTASQLGAMKREAALSRILHDALDARPDFARVNDWNFEQRPFFIESAYGGPDLAAWAEARGGIAALPLARRVTIVAAIARTVAAAHGVGVLHRDIKPGNVLVTGDPGAEIFCLIDFGSARLTEAARLAASSITGLSYSAESQPDHQLSGTFRYMAPEIAAGGAPSIAADVFALGILLYQMVAGDLTRPLSAGWEADIADELLREDVAFAAAGDPARRLQSATTLAERLERLEARRAEDFRERQRQAEHADMLRMAELQRQEADANALRTAHALQLARRTRKAALILSALLATAVALAGYALTLRGIAAAQRNRAEKLAEIAQNSVSSLVNDMTLHLRDASGVRLADLQHLLGGADAILGRMAGLVPDDEAVQRLKANALTGFAETYVHAGDLSAALDAAQRAVALQTRLLAAHPHDPMLSRDLAESWRWIGDAKLRQRDFSGALAAYRQDVETLQQIEGQDPSDPELQQRLARADQAVGDVFLGGGDVREALAAYRRAGTIVARGLAAHPDQPAWQLDMSTNDEKIGDALDAQGDSRGSLAAYQATLSIRQALVARDPRNTRWTRDLAVTEGDVGEEQLALHAPKHALAPLLAAHSIYQHLADSDPANAMYARDVADNANDIGNAEAQSGDISAAIDYYTQGIAIIRPLIEKSPSDTIFQQDLLELETGVTKAFMQADQRAQASHHALLALDMAKHLAATHPGDAAIESSLREATALAQRTGAQ
jgi:DNA-binding winged helix-turn-helix (wHTH) protein/tetratricopeptide (TPR) repeat protein